MSPREHSGDTTHGARVRGNATFRAVLQREQHETRRGEHAHLDSVVAPFDRQEKPLRNLTGVGHDVSGRLCAWEGAFNGDGCGGH